MILLCKEREVFKYLIHTIQDSSIRPNEDMRQLALVEFQRFLLVEDTLHFELPGRDFEYQEVIRS
jgi:hypothetical protein